MRKANARRWIPAFAGMTKYFRLTTLAGLTKFAGMTKYFRLTTLAGMTKFAGMTTRHHLRRPRACGGPVSFMLLLLAATSALAQEPDPAAGKIVFDDWCRPCHDIEPRKHPGTAALQVLYKGEKPAALEQRLDLTPDLVSFYVRNGVSIMPFFRKTEIDDRELVDLGAYLSPDNLRSLGP